jgi:hypothetical protein
MYVKICMYEYNGELYPCPPGPKVWVRHIPGTDVFVYDTDPSIGCENVNMKANPGMTPRNALFRSEKIQQCEKKIYEL